MAASTAHSKMALTPYQKGAVGIFKIQVVSPALAILPANTMNCHAMAPMISATTMAASASNVRLMRGQRATGRARMTMLLRSIKPTGRQQLTASAIATAATSRTPSMG